MRQEGFTVVVARRRTKLVEVVESLPPSLRFGIFDGEDLGI